MFTPWSRGSFQNLRKICDNMLNRSPGALLKALTSPPPPTMAFVPEPSRQRPLLFYLVDRLEDPSVGAIIVSCLMFPVNKLNKIERIARFEGLRKEKFLEYILKTFIGSDSPSYVASGL